MSALLTLYWNKLVFERKPNNGISEMSILHFYIVLYDYDIRN